ncbi:MAG: hypothetical protein V1821_00710 [bacterium]
MKPKQSKPKQNRQLILSIGLLILGLAAGSGLTYSIVKNITKVQPIAETTQPEVAPLEMPETGKPRPVADQPVGFVKPEDPTVAKLEVAWQAPVRKEYKEILNKIIPVDFKPFALQTEGARQDFTTLGLWETGTVKGGAFDGHKVYLTFVVWEGLGSSTEPHRFIISPDGATARMLTKKIGASANEFLLFTSAPNLEIPEAQLPAELITTSGRVLSRSDNFSFGGANYWQWSYSKEYPEQEWKKIGSTKDGLDLFTRGIANCIFAFGPDGQPFSYSSTIPSKQAENGYGEMPKITWKSAYPDIHAYQPYTLSGCGSHDCVNVVTREEMGTVVVAGTTSEGDPIYAPKDPLTNADYKKAYEGWIYFDEQTKAKPSFEAFAKDNPSAVFYWQDAFGRWVRYTMADTQPMAECGKPVIYLYPEKTSSVSVRLPSFVKITKSEPAYNRGWNVSAEPDGTLTDKSGATYGSLYWDGVGVGYETPKTGFIVKDGEVEKFFDVTLPRYGLNQKEAREFKDFWLPVVTGAPYYRVSFLTEEWSKAVPLNVSPRPQTQIRILMDWKKLGAPVSIPEPNIVTPKREGFTLVEWGGLLPK